MANFNFIIVLVPKFPGSLNLSFRNLSIHQFSRKNPSLAQFIPRIYNKNYYTNSKVFLGRYISRVSFGFGVIFGEKSQKGKNYKIWAKQVPTPQRREPTPRHRSTLQRGMPSPRRG